MRARDIVAAIMRPLPTLSRIAFLSIVAAVAGCGSGASTHGGGDASVVDSGREESDTANDATTGTGEAGGMEDAAATDGPSEPVEDATPSFEAGADTGGADAGTESGADGGDSSAEVNVDSSAGSDDSSAGDSGTEDSGAGGSGGSDSSVDGAPDSGGVIADASVDGGPLHAIALAAGYAQTCALLSDGTVECWGANYLGQLGNGTTTGPEQCSGSGACSTTPVKVSGLTGVTVIAAGDAHACALLSNGTVQCWGDNAYGQLGDGMSTGPETCAVGGSFGCSSVPVTVSGLSGVIAITAGYAHTCALLSGGTLECWGDNAYGELGTGSCTGPQQCDNPDGAYACSTTPVAVPGLSGVTAVAAGDDGTHTCALLSGGVECWGFDQLGELGNGTTTGPQTCTWGSFDYTTFTSPVAVSGLTGATSVAAGGEDSCALVADGGVECWGMNYYGQLGDGTAGGPEECDTVYPCSTTPIVVSGLTGATSVVTGGADTCALLSGGTVDCWGANAEGELGVGADAGSLECDAYTNCSTIPVPVSGLSGVTSLAAGSDHTCALQANGSVWCWGYNDSGQLGNGTITDSPLPGMVSL
jgi:alpha-tubulin suppressor-like RCC1 family protein